MADEGGFGPWAAGLETAERVARTRAMRALAVVLARPHAEFIAALAAGETDQEALRRARDLLGRIPTLPRRRLLSTYLVVAQGVRQ